MAKKRRAPASPSGSDVTADAVPVVGLREPCPCGSGRRYKACHGRDQAHRGDRRVVRPFAGLPSECDWVALREIVPAATSPLRLRSGQGPDRTVTLATVLPMAWPALVRVDGAVFLGLQVNVGSGDPSRDAAYALQQALDTEPGNAVPPVGLPEPGPRLQDLLDPDAPLDVTVHEGFDFWLEDAADIDPTVRASLERANAGVVPTSRLSGVEAAYWCRVNQKEHLRWVLPFDEEPLLDAMARLHSRGDDSLGDGTRYVGSFRAAGLLAPVWDLPVGTGAAVLEGPAAAYWSLLTEALADPRPLSDDERRARSGLLSRQITLR